MEKLKQMEYQGNIIYIDSEMRRSVLCKYYLLRHVGLEKILELSPHNNSFSS